VLLAPITLNINLFFSCYIVFSKHLQVAAALTLSEAVCKLVAYFSSDCQPGSCILQPYINHYFIKLCFDGVSGYFLFMFQQNRMHKSKKYVPVVLYKEIHAYDCVCYGTV
jgi:uncharacterized membrane protein